MSGYGFSVGTSGYADEDRLVNWQRSDTNLDQNRTHGPTHEQPTAWPPLPPGEVGLSGPVESNTDINFQDGQQTIDDYSSATAVCSPTYTYVHASYIDESVMRGGNCGLRYYHRNQQYSITALTDGGGSIAERYSYTAYGQVSFHDALGIAQSASESGNRYTYTGREWDEGLSLYHYRARIDDAVAGRLVSRDPIGYVADGYNLYGYVGARPLHYLDPEGLEVVVPSPPTVTPSPATPGPIWPSNPWRIRIPKKVVGIAGPVGVGVGISIAIRPYTTPYTDPWWHEQFVYWFPSDRDCPKRPSCKQRHPNWPACESTRDKQPQWTASNFLKDHCSSVSSAFISHCVEIPNVTPGCGAGGGTQYHCFVSDPSGIIPEGAHRISIRCCNCCGKQDESQACESSHWSQTGGPPTACQ